MTDMQRNQHTGLSHEALKVLRYMTYNKGVINSNEARVSLGFCLNGLLEAVQALQAFGYTLSVVGATRTAWRLERGYPQVATHTTAGR